MKLFSESLRRHFLMTQTFYNPYAYVLEYKSFLLDQQNKHFINKLMENDRCLKN